MANFRITYPPADPKDVSDLEARIGRPLPDDYRQFLLTANGGLQPDQKLFPIPGEGDGIIQVFFGFYGDYDDIREAILRWEEAFPHALPIARDLCGNHILLGLTDKFFGNVFWCDHELLPDGSEAEPILIAQSFTEFFSFFDEPLPNTRNA
jgi:cell wall assembly regulator SMI1